MPAFGKKQMYAPQFSQFSHLPSGEIGFAEAYPYLSGDKIRNEKERTRLRLSNQNIPKTLRQMDILHLDSLFKQRSNLLWPETSNATPDFRNQKYQLRMFLGKPDKFLGQTG